MPAPIRLVDELGFPLPPKFEDFRVNTDEPSPPRKPLLARFGRWRWLLLILVPVLLFGRQAIDFGRGIVASVQLQRAERECERRNYKRAIVHASRAVDWEPDAVRRAQDLLFRADLHERLRQAENSMRDCDEGIKILNQEKPSLDALTALAMLYKCRGWAQFRLGHRRAAIDDCKMALEVWPGPHRDGDSFRYWDILNAKAYICALTSSEVDAGVKAINEALLAEGERSPGMLDTRACLEYRQGKLDAALSDMEVAIRLIQGQRQILRRAWDAGTDIVSGDEMDLERKALAVMFYHRGEIHRKLAAEAKDKPTGDLHKNRADADFASARQFGFDDRLDEALEPAAAERAGT